MTYYKGEDFKSLVSEGVVLVDFYADWCAPCKMLGTIIEELDTDIKILKVNVDEYSDLANEFKIMSIPHLMFYKDGKVVLDEVGFMDKDTLLEKIEEVKNL